MVVTSVAIETGFTVQTVAQTGDSMVQFWMVVDMHVANDRFMVQTVQNWGVPQLQCPDKVVDLPAVAVHRQGVDVPVIMQ